MKKIKKIIGLGVAGLIAIATPLFIATAPVALTGCGVLQGGGGTNNTAQIDATALILENTARVGAIAAITPPTGDTNNAKYFDLAAQGIGTFITGKDYSPRAFQQALLAIDSPQLKNIWVQLGIGAVIDLYQVYFSQYVQDQVNGNFAAGTFLLAIQNGFNQAIGKPVVQPIPVVTPPQLKAGHPVPGGVLPRPVNR